mmetsp:Transcript_51078/g.91323  ORF Transcript_51078/g.91323 Transcript_51078/m.91323 type:complete len:90 (-) Transcript_51078:5-274(-)
MAEDPVPTLQRKIPGHGGAVRCLLLHRDHLFSGSSDASIRIWSADRGTCLRRLEAHGAPIVSLAVDRRDGIWACSEDGSLRVWQGARLD